MYLSHICLPSIYIYRFTCVHICTYKVRRCVALTLSAMAPAIKHATETDFNDG